MQAGNLAARTFITYFREMDSALMKLQIYCLVLLRFLLDMLTCIGCLDVFVSLYYAD